MLRADAKQMLILFIKVLSTKICYLLQIYCTAYITPLLLYFLIFPLILAFFVLFTLVVSGCHLSGWVWTGQDWNTWPRVFGPVGHVRTLIPARTTLLTWGSGTATEPKQHLKTYTLSSYDCYTPSSRHCTTIKQTLFEEQVVTPCKTAAPSTTPLMWWSQSWKGGAKAQSIRSEFRYNYNNDEHRTTQTQDMAFIQSKSTTNVNDHHHRCVWLLITPSWSDSQITG